MTDSSKVLPVGTILRSASRVYTIAEVLGQGGFGITYRATAVVSIDNIEIDAQFAIKEHFVDRCCERDSTTHTVIYSRPVANDVENSRKNFLSEARRLRDLSRGQNRHPNIVCVNETFEANNTAYFVMEYLKGESLSSYVRHHGPLSDSEMRSIMEPIIDAVAFLHREYITHLDIKPANIMLTRSKSGWLRPVLIDFGLSRHFDPVTGEPSSTIQQAGFSEGYAPIEQSEAFTHFSPGTDVYSLGATMLFALTGRTPVSAAQIDADTVRNALPAGLSASTVAAITESMRYVRKERPENATALLMVLTGGNYTRSYDDDPIIPEIYEPTPTPTPSRPIPTPSRPTPTPRGEQSPYPWRQPRQAPTPTPTPTPKNRTGLYVGIAIAVVLLALGCAVWFTGGFGLFESEKVEDKKVEAYPPSVQAPAPGTETEETTPALEPGEMTPEPVPMPEPESPASVYDNYYVPIAGLDMKMVWVEGGSFWMGCEDSDAYKDEMPVHSVKLDSYYISETEVTQAQWEMIMGTSVQYQASKVSASISYIDSDYPMCYVSWDEAQEFCKRLSRLTNRTYSLPTEAQWEYAARGGKMGHGTKFSGSELVDDVAWYAGNSDDSTRLHLVKSKDANELGLYDMSGNVTEWCLDWYSPYEGNYTSNPAGPSSKQYRVLRGGSCYNGSRYCRVSFRNYSNPKHRNDGIGFRVVARPV